MPFSRPARRHLEHAAIPALTLSLHLALGLASIAPAHAQQAQTTRSYQIPAGPLPEVLTRYASQAGIHLAGSATLAQDKHSPGLYGDYDIEQGLAALLASSGLQATRNAENQYVLEPQRDVPSLPAITITGTSEETSAQRLNPPSSVASKIPLSQREIPQTVTVLTQEVIREQNLQSLDEAMRRTPGVMVLQSDADRVQYYARGFPISSMMVDGLPVIMNSDMSATAATNAPNLAMYERVEVLDGPAGLYGGLGSAGGVISLIRKRAPKVFSTSLDLGAGSKHRLLGTVDIGGPLNEAATVRGRLVATGERKDLNQTSTWRKDQAYYGTLEADLAPGTLAHVGLSYAQRESNVGWANQTPLYSNGKLAGGRSDFYGSPWNRDRYTQTNAFASLEHTLNEDWKLTAAANFDHNTARVLSAEIFGQIDPATHEATYGTTNTDYYENNQSYDLNAIGKYTLFGRQHDVIVGANYGRMYNHGTSYYGTSNLFNFETVDIRDINFSKPHWSGLPADTAKGAVTQTQYGIYGNTRFQVTDAVTAIGGARVSWWETRFRPNATYNPFGYESSTDKYRAKLTPYAGLIYNLNAQYSVYSSYSSIFQPQALRSESGTLLKPMEGEQYEIGVKGDHLDGRLQTTAAIYQLTQRNRAVATDQTGQFFRATGKARSRGLDLRATGQIMPGWTVLAGYTYNDAKYLDQDSLDPSASALSQIAPRHLLRVWTNYRLPGDWSRWEVGGGVNATSALYGGTDSEKIRQGGFYTVDTRLAYRVNEQVSMALNVNNLLNRQYFHPLTTYQGVVFGEGRRLFLTMRVTY